MAFTPKDWKDEPDHATPISAAALEDLETRLAAYIDTETAAAVLSAFNVKNFGAQGDGSTNDTAAIQAAIDACYAAGGGTVFLPPGTYLVTALSRNWATNPGNSVNIRGAGKRATFLQKTGATTTPILSLTTTTTPIETYSDISDLAIIGNAKAHHGIAFSGAARLTLTNLDIRLCNRALSFAGNVSVNIDLCTLQSNNTAIYARASGGTPSNAHNVTRSTLSNNTTYGIDYNQNSGLWLRGCDLELNGTSGNLNTGALVIGATPAVAGVSQNSITECWFEANLGRTISILGGDCAIDRTLVISPESHHAVYVSSAGQFGMSYTDIPGSLDELQIDNAGAAVALRGCTIGAINNSGGATNLTVTQSGNNVPNDRGFSQDVYISAGKKLSLEWANGVGHHEIRTNTGPGSLEIVPYASHVVTVVGGGLASYDDGISTRTKAGIPVDGDFTTPRVGLMCIDETHNRLYVRYSNGSWHYATLT